MIRKAAAGDAPFVRPPDPEYTPRSYHSSTLTGPLPRLTLSQPVVQPCPRPWRTEKTDDR